MSKKAKGNKQILEGINRSLNIVKKIKDNKEFTQDEKQNILTDFVGMSKDNNSYFTPIEICNMIVQMLNIKSGKIADFSGGIGNMIVPLIEKYGKLHNDIQFDLFELDENNSMAASKAWEDYEQVNVYSDYNTIDRCEEIPDNHYDFVIGNPPFSGSVKYWNEWNHNKNGSAKNANIADAFVDLSVNKVKDGGYVALVLPLGHLYRSGGTAQLRGWLKDNTALRAIIPLDSETFANAGVKGTSVSTVLIVWQKGVKQDKVFYAKLQDKDDLAGEMEALAYQFNTMFRHEHEITYQSDYLSGLHAKMKRTVPVWSGKNVY